MRIFLEFWWIGIYSGGSRGALDESDGYCGCEFGRESDWEFQSGNVPRMGNVTDLAWVVILWGLGRKVVLYWELSNWS